MPNDLPLAGPAARPGRARRALVPLLALLALGLLLAPQGAGAARTWCRTDPGLEIGGREAHVNLYSYQEMFAAATGPVELVVTVPVGKEGKTKLLYMDDGFGHGYSLTVKASAALKDSAAGTDVLVEAYAPAADGALAVQLEVVPVSAGKASTVAKGTANAWIAAKAKV